MNTVLYAAQVSLFHGLNLPAVPSMEFTNSYNHENIYAYDNFAYSVAQGTQVESGQFNFAPDELKYINSHYIFLDHDQTFTNSAGAVYTWHGFAFSIDGIYGSGLRSGFANTGNLPYYIQVDGGITRRVTLPNHGGVLEFRTAMVNINDHIYQVRNGSGIGCSRRNTVRAGRYTAASSGNCPSPNPPARKRHETKPHIGRQIVRRTNKCRNYWWPGTR